MPPEPTVQIPSIEPQAMSPVLPPKRRKWPIVAAGAILLLVLLAGAFILLQRSGEKPEPVTSVACAESVSADAPMQYLAFQLFSDINTQELGDNFPPPLDSVRSAVQAIAQRIGEGECANKKLAFIVGPLALDHTDEMVRSRIKDAFAIALAENVAVGFHIDDSMFWGRLSELNTPEAIEWLDWNKTLNTGRYLAWGPTATKLMPQLCLNSQAVVSTVKARAELIGEEVELGIKALEEAGKPELFAGVIAGWETQMGHDFDTGRGLGYCALTNKGYSASNPPADIDQARADIVKEFIELWTGSLADAGVPKEKLYSHIAFLSKSEFRDQGLSGSYIDTVNFSPAPVAFSDKHAPGFSTYPEPGHFDEIKAELQAHGNPPWISAEGTALDPAQAEIGVGVYQMEPYLARAFNNGAVLVNVFGWGIGPVSNPFRQVAENDGAIAAYRKFLSGAALSESVPGAKASLTDRVRKISETLPEWAPEHKDKQATVTALMAKLDMAVQNGDLKTADALADEVLSIIEGN